MISPNKFSFKNAVAEIVTLKSFGIILDFRSRNDSVIKMGKAYLIWGEQIMVIDVKIECLGYK